MIFNFSETETEPFVGVTDAISLSIELIIGH